MDSAKIQADYLRVMELAGQHPEYIKELTVQALAQLWLAAALTDRLVWSAKIADQTPFAFSWLRTEKPIPSWPPEEDEWRSTTGRLWVADVVAPAGASGIKVGKALRRELVKRGIAREGEKVYFFRQHTHRFGSLTARGDA